MGAVAPSSPALARAMAREIPRDALADHAPVIELGGGTGSITRGLLDAGLPAHRLVVVERDSRLAEGLRSRFSGLKVVCGDAVGLAELLAGHGIPHAAAIVSGLPLLLFPEATRHRLIESCFALLGPGRPLIQFTYGFGMPVPALAHGLVARRARWVARNVPPAFVWTFTRHAAAG
jgi:phosphatidylethanolamine/phosphatidyl-N-methylethanolamine N-methyltransferase